MRTTFKIAVGAAAILAAFGASAQAYPVKDKNITIVVPFSAGGPTDRVARDLAEALRKPLGGATVVVENAAGAGSTIGAAKVARAQPDGYTLLLNHIGMATIPTLYRKLSFNVLNDFEFLGIVNDVPMTIISRPTLEAKNYKELATWIAQNKEKVNLGQSGLGSAGHLCGLMFQHALKSHMTPVAYKGAAPANQDLIGGQVDIFLAPYGTKHVELYKAGRIKVLALLNPTRIDTAKDFPAISESRSLKDFTFNIWTGYFVKRETPEPVVQALHKALTETLGDPAVKTALEANSQLLPKPQTLAEADKAYADGTQQFRAIVKSIGLQAQ